MLSYEQNDSNRTDPEMDENDMEDPSIGLVMSVDDSDPERSRSPQLKLKCIVPSVKSAWPRRIDSQYSSKFMSTEVTLLNSVLTL